MRALGSLTISWDLSIQLEAAHRFINGLGLTNTFTSQLDLNQPPVSEYLTHFPPGLPLLVSCFLFLGVSIPTALKLIYGLTTIIGWAGWSMIAAQCLTGPIKIRSVSLPAHLLIAGILPVFYTPPWTYQGTDIILWAGTPIVVLLLLRSFEKQNWISPLFVGGVLCTCLISFRYASAFLIPTVLIGILYKGFPRAKLTLVRSGLFVCSLFALFLPLIPYAVFKVIQGGSIEAFSHNPLQTHGSRYLEANILDIVVRTLRNLAVSASNTYTLTGIFPTQLKDAIASGNPVVSSTLGCLFIVLLLWLPFALAKRNRYKKYYGDLDVPVILSLMLVSFLLFSIALAFSIAYSPLFVERYYIPVQPCLILIIYRLLTLLKAGHLLRWTASIFVGCFILLNLVGRPLAPLLTNSWDSLLFPVLGSNTEKYISNQLLSPTQTTLEFLVQAEKKYPSSLIFAQSYPFYMGFYSFEDPLRVRRVPDISFWENAYLSEDTTIFWVTNSSFCTLICPSPGNFNSGDWRAPIPALVSLPNSRTVFTNAQENTIVTVADLPAGYRFSTEHEPAP